MFFWVMAPPFRQFAAFTTVLYQSASIGIPAVAVSMLMIGGEFDLSAGVAVTTSSLAASIFATEVAGSLWVGVVFALFFSLCVGAFNGWLMIRTKLPSFLVTLGTFLMLQGLNIAITKLITGNVATQDIAGMAGFDTLKTIFASNIMIGRTQISVAIVYWVLFVAIATWVLLRTKVGNWIYAVGGQGDSARAVGVPVKAVKIGLFMAVGFSCWFLAMHLLFAYDTVQSGAGIGQELLYIAASVVGGCLLTGGYGSAVGSALGAFIFGMTTEGVIYADWDPDWFQFFVGATLVLATVVNTWIRMRAMGGSEMTGTQTAIIELKDVGKSYGAISALRGVNLTVRQGEVTCILGDNGAGKSTLISIIAGLFPHDSGDYLVDGEPRKFSSPREALNLGIAAVYQTLALVPLLPVWRNFFLGSELEKGTGPFRRLDVGEMLSKLTTNCIAWASTSKTSISLSVRCPAVSARSSRSRAQSTLGLGS